MGLVTISNTNEKIDFNNLEYLTWKDNWNGGQWNDWEVLNNPDDYKFYAVSSNEIHEVPVVVKEVSGVDSDMGHNYSWKSLRLFVKDYGAFGGVLVDSQNMLNGYKIMYLKKDVSGN